VVDLVLDVTFDTDLFSTIGHLPMAPKRADPVLTVGFDVFRKGRIVGESRVEEVGVRKYTNFFFEFGDDLVGEIVLGIVVLVIFVLFLPRGGR